jgi:FkbM family methyltransferase
MIATTIAAASILLALAAAGLALLLRRRLSAVHLRIHLLERTQLELERQVASLSRAASRAQAALSAPGQTVEVSCHAQHGEEFFLWELFEFKSQGTFVEIGAYDGVSLSNSLFFEKLGWRGLLVEAHPELAERARHSRPSATVVHAALGAVDGGEVTFSMVRGERGLDTLSFVETTESHRQRIGSRKGVIEQVVVPARTLRSLLDEVGLTAIDWMSVDVEGGELEVLRGASLDSVRPRVIVVEDNSRGIDPEVPKYLAGFGYKRIRTVGCNDFYLSDA